MVEVLYSDQSAERVTLTNKCFAKKRTDQIAKRMDL